MGNVVPISQYKRRGFREGTGQSCYYGTSYRAFERRLTWRSVFWFHVAMLALGVAYGIVAR